MLSSFPGLPTKSFLKSILHSNENERHEVSVSIRFERQVISGVRPTDQRRLAGTTFSGSDDWFLQLTRSYSATCTRSSQLQRWHAAKRRFSFRFQKALPVYCEIAHVWRKTQKNVLVCDSSVHVVELRVLVYSRVHPKVLPNTETFLHSRVLFVTCVVPALCQIMYSLSVCSDGTTSAAPRSFRQNRPPARTLSLTESTTCYNGLRATHSPDTSSPIDQMLAQANRVRLKKKRKEKKY